MPRFAISRWVRVGETLRVLAIATVICACGSTSSAPDFAREDASGGHDDDGGIIDDGDTPEDTGTFTGGDAPPPGSCRTCSADLHDVIDCNSGQVLQTCPATQGCGSNGTCVAPCASATANRSSIGCEYYSVAPDDVTEAGCFVAFIANTWNAPAAITLEFAGMALDISKSLYATERADGGLTYATLAGGVVPPGQVGLLFLAYPPGGSGVAQCPVGTTPAYAGEAAVQGVGLGNAFHITTSVPVVAYDIFPYGGAAAEVTSATLLLPTSVWDVNYVAASAWSGSGSLPVAGEIALVASQDQTTLSFTPTAPIVEGAGVMAAASGATQTYMLDKGQFIQFSQGGAAADLSGSVVAADKPVGVWGGHQCMSIPNSDGSCDTGHQQIPPVKALGNEYVAVRYRSRTATEESVPWRILGAVDGTQLTYDPAPPTNAPASLGRGQLVEFNSASPFLVRSQDAAHPFYVAGHMTSSDFLQISMGDPETVNVIPPQQFLSHYVFFTDPTYGETNLVVVRNKATGKDVTLDCQSGPLTGWQAVGSKYEFVRVDLQHNGAPVGACDNGRHEMTSAAPFGLTVWGFDAEVSYAYPAGASVQPINAVVVSPPPPK
jgi:hypothetical protein